jgi:hypothetical protein
MKNILGKFKTILIILGILVAGFLVCWGLIVLKVFIMNL